MRNPAGARSFWQDAKSSVPNPLPNVPGATANERVVILENMSGWHAVTLFFE